MAFLLDEQDRAFLKDARNNANYVNNPGGEGENEVIPTPLERATSKSKYGLLSSVPVKASEIVSYYNPLTFIAPSKQKKIQKIKENGYSEKEILDFIAKKEIKMVESGYSYQEIDKFLGRNYATRNAQAEYHKAYSVDVAVKNLGITEQEAYERINAAQSLMINPSVILDKETGDIVWKEIKKQYGDELQDWTIGKAFQAGMSDLNNKKSIVEEMSTLHIQDVLEDDSIDVSKVWEIKDLTDVEKAFIIRAKQDPGKTAEIKSRIDEIKKDSEGYQRLAEAWNPGEYLPPTSPIGKLVEGITRSAPYTLDSVINNLPVLLVGSPVLAAAISASKEGRMERADVYATLRKKGMSHKEAYKTSEPVEWQNFLLLLVSNSIQNKFTFGEPSIGLDMLSEGAEEIGQSIISSTNLGNEIDTGELIETGLIGGVSGGLFGVAGSSLKSATDATIGYVSNRSKEIDSTSTDNILDLMKVAIGKSDDEIIAQRPSKVTAVEQLAKVLSKEEFAEAIGKDLDYVETLIMTGGDIQVSAELIQILTDKGMVVGDETTMTEEERVIYNQAAVTDKAISIKDGVRDITVKEARGMLADKLATIGTSILNADTEYGKQARAIRDSMIMRMTAVYNNLGNKNAEKVAKADANLYASIISTLSSRVGISPSQFNDKYGLVVRAKEEVSKAEEQPKIEKEKEENIQKAANANTQFQNIINAYLDAGGRFNELVDISKINERIPESERPELANNLVQMQRWGQFVYLNVNGNPWSLSDWDRENPVMISGTPRHVVYMNPQVQQQIKQQAKQQETASEQAAAGETQSLFQAVTKKKTSQPRAKIEIQSSGAGIAEFFSSSDASSFIHEVGHWGSNLIKVLAEDGNQDFVKDWETLKQFIQWEEGQTQFSVDQQETLAKWFEQYFLTGKAPSASVKSTFQKIKSWLKAIYAQVQSLGSPISDEVRGVFDRMIATEEEMSIDQTFDEIAQNGKILEADADALSKAADKIGNEIKEVSQKSQLKDELIPMSKVKEMLAELAVKHYKAMEKRDKAYKARDANRKRRETIKSTVKYLRQVVKDNTVNVEVMRQIKDIIKGYSTIKPHSAEVNLSKAARDAGETLTFNDLYNIMLSEESDGTPAEYLRSENLHSMTFEELKILRRAIRELQQYGRKIQQDKELKELQVTTSYVTDIAKEIEGAKPIRRVIDKKGGVITSREDVNNQGAIPTEDSLLARISIKGSLVSMKHKAFTLMPTRLIDWISGGMGKYNTLMTKLFSKLPNAARGEKARNLARRQTSFMEALKATGLTLDNLWAERELEVRNIDGSTTRATLQVSQLMHIVYGLKNPETRKAILKANLQSFYDENVTGVDAETQTSNIIAAVNDILTDSEKQLIEFFNEDGRREGQRIRDMMADVFNYDMELVEEYYAAMYRFMPSGEQLLDPNVIGGFNKDNPKLSINKNMTISRVKDMVKQVPIKLGLYEVWLEGIEQQEQLVAMGGITKQINKVLEYTDNKGEKVLKRAIIDRFGVETWRQLGAYYNMLVSNDIDLTAGYLDGLVGHARRMIVKTKLPFNLRSYFMQVTGIPRFMAFVPVSDIINSCRRLSSPSIGQEISERIQQLDPLTASRFGSAETRAVAYYQQMSQGEQSKLRRKIESIGMTGLELFSLIDSHVAFIGWDAVYRKAMRDGKSEEQAVQEAQIAVQVTQQAQSIVDTPAFMRGEVAQIFMFLGSELAQLYQIISHDLPQSVREGRVKEAIRITTGYIIASAAIQMMQGDMPEGEELPDIAAWVAKSSASQAISSIPIAGRMLSTTIFGGYQNTADPVTSIVTNVYKAGEQIANGKYEKGVYSTADALAMFTNTGVPTLALYRIWQSLPLIEQGEFTAAFLALMGNAKKTKDKVIIK